MSDVWKTFCITIIVLIIIISGVLIVAFISQECQTNAGCSEDEYCSYSHKCVPYPSREFSTKNLLPSAFVVGIAIVLGAYIIRGKIKYK